MKKFSFLTMTFILLVLFARTGFAQDMQMMQLQSPTYVLQVTSTTKQQVPFIGAYMTLSGSDSQFFQVNDTTPFTTVVSGDVMNMMFKTNASNSPIMVAIYKPEQLKQAKKVNKKLLVTTGLGHTVIIHDNTLPDGKGAFVVAR